MIKLDLCKWVMPKYLRLDELYSERERSLALGDLEARNKTFRWRMFFALSVSEKQILIFSLGDLCAKGFLNMSFLENLHQPNQGKINSFLYFLDKNEVEKVNKDTGKINLVAKSMLNDLYKNGFGEYIFKQKGRSYYCLSVCDLGWKRKVIVKSDKAFGWERKEYTNKRLHCIDGAMKLAEEDGQAKKIRDLLAHTVIANRELGYQLISGYQ